MKILNQRKPFVCYICVQQLSNGKVHKPFDAKIKEKVSAAPPLEMAM